MTVLTKTVVIVFSCLLVLALQAFAEVESLSEDAKFQAQELWQYQAERWFDQEKAVYRLYKKLQYGRLPENKLPASFIRTLFYQDIAETYLDDDDRWLPDYLIRLITDLPPFYSSDYPSDSFALCFDIESSMFDIKILSKPRQPIIDCQWLDSSISTPNDGYQQKNCTLPLSEISPKMTLSITGGKFNSACSIQLNKQKTAVKTNGRLALVVYSRSSEIVVEEADGQRNDTDAPFPLGNYLPDTIVDNMAGWGGGADDKGDDKKLKPRWVKRPELEMSVILPGLPLFSVATDDNEANIESAQWSINDGQTDVIVHFQLNDGEQTLSLTLDQWQLLVEHGVHQSPALMHFFMSRLSRGQLRLQVLLDELSEWLNIQEAQREEGSSQNRAEHIRTMIASVLDDYETIPPEDISLEGGFASIYEQYLYAETGWQAPSRSFDHGQYLDNLRSIVTLLSTRDVLAKELRRILAKTDGHLLIESIENKDAKGVRDLILKQINHLRLEILKYAQGNINEQKFFENDNDSSTLIGNLNNDVEIISAAVKVKKDTVQSLPAQTSQPSSTSGHSGLVDGSQEASVDKESIQKGLVQVAQESGSAESVLSDQRLLVPTGRQAFSSWVQELCTVDGSKVIDDYAVPFCSSLIGRLRTKRLLPNQVPWFIDYLKSASQVTPEESSTFDFSNYDTMCKKLIDSLLDIVNKIKTFDESISPDEITHIQDILKKLSNIRHCSLVPTGLSGLLFWIENNSIDGVLNQTAYTFLYQIFNWSLDEYHDFPHWYFHLVAHCQLESLWASMNQPLMIPVSSENQPEIVFAPTHSEQQEPYFEDTALLMPQCAVGVFNRKPNHAVLRNREEIAARICNILPDAQNWGIARDLLKEVIDLQDLVLSENLNMYYLNLILTVEEQLKTQQWDMALTFLKELNSINRFFRLSDPLVKHIARANQRLIDQLLQRNLFSRALESVCHSSKIGSVDPVLCMRFTWQSLLMSGSPMRVQSMAHSISPFEIDAFLINEANAHINAYIEANQRHFTGVELDILKAVQRLLKSPVCKEEADSSDKLYPQVMDSILSKSPEYLLDLLFLDPLTVLLSLDFLRQKAIEFRRSPERIDFIHTQDQRMVQVMTDRALFLKYCNTVISNNNITGKLWLYLFKKLQMLPEEETGVFENCLNQDLYDKVWISGVKLALDRPPGNIWLNMSPFLNELYDGTRREWNSKISHPASVLPSDGKKNLKKEVGKIKKDLKNIIKEETEKGVKGLMKDLMVEQGYTEEAELRNDLKPVIKEIVRQTRKSLGHLATTKEISKTIKEQRKDSKHRSTSTVTCSLPKGKDRSLLVYSVPQQLERLLLRLHGLFSGNLDKSQKTGSFPAHSDYVLKAVPGDLTHLIYGVILLRQGIYAQSLRIFAKSNHGYLGHYLAGLAYLSGVAGSVNKEKALEHFIAASGYSFGPAVAQLFEFEDSRAQAIVKSLSSLDDDEVQLLVTPQMHLLVDSPSETLGILEPLVNVSESPRVSFRLSQRMSKAKLKYSEYRCRLVQHFFNNLTPFNSVFFINDPYRKEFVTEVFSCLNSLSVLEVINVLKKLPWFSPEDSETAEKQIHLRVGLWILNLLPSSENNNFSKSVFTLVKFEDNEDLIKLVKTAIMNNMDLVGILKDQLIHQEPDIKLISLLLKLNEVCNDCILADISTRDKILIFDRLRETSGTRENLTLFYQFLERLRDRNMLEATPPLVKEVFRYLEESEPSEHSTWEAWFYWQASGLGVPPATVYSTALLNHLQQTSQESRWRKYLTEKIKGLDFTPTDWDFFVDQLIDQLFRILPSQDDDHILRIFHSIEYLAPQAILGERLSGISNYFRQACSDKNPPNWIDEFYRWVVHIRDGLSHREFESLALDVMPYVRKKFSTRPKESVRWLNAAVENVAIDQCMLFEHLARDAFQWVPLDQDWLRMLYTQYSECRPISSKAMNSLVVQHLSLEVREGRKKATNDFLLELLTIVNPAGYPVFWEYIESDPRMKAIIAHLLADKRFLLPLISGFIQQGTLNELITELITLSADPLKMHLDVLKRILSIPGLSTQIPTPALLNLISSELIEESESPLIRLLFQELDDNALAQVEEKALLKLMTFKLPQEVTLRLFNILYESTPDKLQDLPVQSYPDAFSIIFNRDSFSRLHFLSLINRLPFLNRQTQVQVIQHVLKLVRTQWFARFCPEKIKDPMWQWVSHLNERQSLSVEFYSAFFKIMVAQESLESSEILLHYLSKVSNSSKKEALPLIIEPLKLLNLLTEIDHRPEEKTLRSVVQMCGERLKLDNPPLMEIGECFNWCIQTVKPIDFLKMMKGIEDYLMTLVEREPITKDAIKLVILRLEEILAKEGDASDIQPENIWDRMLAVQQLKSWSQYNPSVEITRILEQASASWGAHLLKVKVNDQSPFARHLKKSMLYVFFRKQPVKDQLSPNLKIQLPPLFSEYLAVEKQWEQFSAAAEDSDTESRFSSMMQLAEKLDLGLLPQAVRKELLSNMNGVAEKWLNDAEISTSEHDFIGQLLEEPRLRPYFIENTLKNMKAGCFWLNLRTLNFLIKQRVLPESDMQLLENVERKVREHLSLISIKPSLAKSTGDSLTLSVLLRLEFGLIQNNYQDVLSEALSNIASIPEILPEDNKDQIAEAVIQMSRTITSAPPGKTKSALSVQRLYKEMIRFSSQTDPKSSAANIAMQAYEQRALLNRPGYLSETGHRETERQAWEQALLHGSKDAFEPLGLSKNTQLQLTFIQNGLVKCHSGTELSQKEIKRLSEFARKISQVEGLEQYPGADRVLRDWEQVEIDWARKQEAVTP